MINTCDGNSNDIVRSEPIKDRHTSALAGAELLRRNGSAFIPCRTSLMSRTYRPGGMVPFARSDIVGRILSAHIRYISES